MQGVNTSVYNIKKKLYLKEILHNQWKLYLHIAYKDMIIF